LSELPSFYDQGQFVEASGRNDFRKELPSHVIDDARQDKTIMWLDKARGAL
jgi:hypothetical protein